jgi:hypothetical protein
LTNDESQFTSYSIEFFTKEKIKARVKNIKFPQWNYYSGRSKNTWRNSRLLILESPQNASHLTPRNHALLGEEVNNQTHAMRAGALVKATIH